MRSRAWVGGCAIAGGAAMMAYAVRSPRSSIFADSVFQGVSARRSIALTFDDGPSESTPALLDLLAKYGAAATFFQCGRNVRRLPEVARAVAEAGHEIGNHTESHARFDFRSSGFMYREIEAAQSVIHLETGKTPRLFRAPYGVRWFGLGEVQKKLGLLGVMWTGLGLDWKWTADRVVRRLMARARNGAIFCLHDGRELAVKPEIEATVNTVRQLLPILKGEGYQFEQVSQILCPTI